MKGVPGVVKGLRSGAVKQLSVVLGNEAGDLDSVVCTCALGAWLQAREPSVPVVPLLNFRREDLPLHTEVLFCFKRLGLDLGLLAFEDDLSWEGVCEGRLKRVALVDHNVVNTPNLAFLDRLVTSILDHHKLERESDPKIDPFVIETVGSCATLVADHIINKDPTYFVS